MVIMTIVGLEDELEKTIDDKPCIGIIFRFNEDAWIGSDGDVNFRKRLRWIKSKSCTGCPKCDWLYDDLSERISNYDLMRDHDIGIDYEDCVHGKLYRLQVGNVSRDWESGVVDDYDLEFVEYKEE